MSDMGKDKNAAELRAKQSLPLELKVGISRERIQEWYEHWNGDVSISVSGGLDSTVLLHLVRSVYPDVKAVFADTGLEFPENRRFLFDNVDNLETVRPKMNFREVIDKYGYPLVSKRISKYISEARNSRDKNGTDSFMYKLRTTGMKRDGRFMNMDKISNKWLYLIDAPFKISDKCCQCLKKEPLSKLNAPFTGQRVEESNRREMTYLMMGCNLFDAKRPLSNPMSFWTHQDVIDYISLHNLKYSPLYDMGYKRSGCVFCMFGCHLEGYPNRFIRLKETHPKLWQYCIYELNLKEPLEYIGIDYGCGFKGEFNFEYGN